ncbi:MAG: tryptophan--tRNA ligase [Deltaproteobacteria bacterium]|nr:MAG: tryptophan--tRNA ligase [Deltaproteobacteria bacterium]
MQRALTGIKPTGDVHLGNYLGMIRPALALQEKYEAYYFIADYHALTSVFDREKLRAHTLETAATWMALGLDPERTILFRQSSIPEVCELAWILTCQVSMGQLERMGAYKQARDRGGDINAGIFNYPSLMAADILLYDSHVVPVGADQKQHVELCRDMAIKVNHRFGEGTLVVPEVSIQPDVATIVGLDGQKMSKSYNNVIPLWLPPKKLRKLVMKIVTDSKGVDEVKDPDTCNVYSLYKLFATPEQTAALRERYLVPGMGYGHAKEELFQVVNATLEEPRERYHEWMAHPERLEEVLAEGARRARSAADVVLERVRDRVGLI